MPKKGYKQSEEHKKKTQIAMKGKFHSEETKRKMSIAHKGNTYGRLGKGIRRSEETKRRISECKKGKKRPKISGENHHNWKGGLYFNKEYVSWSKNKRNRVIKRLQIDEQTHTFGEWQLLKEQYGFTCPCCKKNEPGIKLTEDHIIPLSRGGSDKIENIQPLCLRCNMMKHTKIIKY